MAETPETLLRIEPATDIGWRAVFGLSVIALPQHIEIDSSLSLPPITSTDKNCWRLVVGRYSGFPREAEVRHGIRLVDFVAILSYLERH